jgi:chemotaxis-related protein WspD
MSCWNKIGVYGDSSCPELDRYAHCRNCPVYATAAVAVLDGALSDQQMAESTGHLTREKPEAITQAHAVAIFRVGLTWLALPSAAVREIVNPRPIHSLAHRRNGVVLGLANIRGELLVCVALRLILNLDEAATGDQPLPAGARMLVMQQDDARIVFPVEHVFGIERFQSRDFGPVPPMLAKSVITYTKAMLSWKGNAVSLLNAQILQSTINRSLASATAT